MIPADREVRLTEIDALARQLFKECGGLDKEWGAVDECVRTHYRKMAAEQLLLNEQTACPEHPTGRTVDEDGCGSNSNNQF